MDSKQACHAWLQQHHQQQHFAERVLEHLAFNSDILDRWTHIGTAQGLTTDLEVATFLIQHYENTWDRAPPAQFCVTCHSPLSLVCSKCCATNLPAPSHHDYTHNPIQALLNLGDNGNPCTSVPQHAAGKGKKRKKDGKKGDGVEHNDDDLLGLYIQFGQAAGSAPYSLAGSNQHHTPPVPNKSQRNNSPGGKTLAMKHDNVEGDWGGEDRNKTLKSYMCVHCAKTIYKLSDFKKHVRTHTQEKPYKCQFCQAAFSDASSAARHRRVHTGEKPFSCSQCPATFAQSSDLTKHRRVHTQERPWECQVCLKTFSDSSRFAHHRRQHQKEAAKLGKAEGKGTGSVAPS